MKIGWITETFGNLARIKIGIALAALIGISISLGVSYQVFESETRLDAREFYGRAKNQAALTQERVDDYWDTMRAVRALFEASHDKVSRDEFETFTRSLLRRYPAILNVSWLPRVRSSERAAIEAAARADGIPNYRIRDGAPGGSLSTAPERDEYYPKFYSTEGPTSPVYGFDVLYDKPDRIMHIRDTSELSSSSPVLLFIGEGSRTGFWAGLPIYAHGQPHDTVEERRRSILGVIQGVFQVHVLFDSMLTAVKTPVRIHVFPPNADADAMPIYSASRLSNSSLEPRPQSELVNGLHLSVPLKIGDVPWTLVLTPEPTGSPLVSHQRSAIILLCGLLLTALLVAFVSALGRWADALRIANANITTQNQKLDAALNNMLQGLLMYDRSGSLTISNQRFAQMFDLPWDEWHSSSIGLTIVETLNYAKQLSKLEVANEPEALARLQSILEQRRTGSVVFERTDGHTYVATCVPMANGGWVITFRDITERRRNEEKIAHLARYDALTDLPNRVLFYERIGEFLHDLGQRHRVAVLSLDLDHFKSVNDTLGHPIGDKLLQSAAERMRGCIRNSDIVARLGGDEFAVVQGTIAQTSDTTALARRLIEAVSAPYEIDGHRVVIGTSIGIAVAPSDGTAPDELMKNADLALYRCKADGGNTYRYFETEMDLRMQERRALELDLRKALVNNEFTVAYQPLVTLKTGKATSCEALIRWNHPQRGSVPPASFIPIAEETGLIVPIGNWVLRRACADAVQWPGDIAVAVNVSPTQFKSDNFIDTVTSALKETGLPASRLELEITESVLMQEGNAASSTLHRLKALGVRIAMDDFGTGYSSLSYLRSFPFNKIKIDQSFIRDVSSNKDSLAILRAVIGLGRSLGIITTAEGVENKKQLEVLLTEGCTEAQGFFFSQPRPASEANELLHSFANADAAVA